MKISASTVYCTVTLTCNSKMHMGLNHGWPAHYHPTLTVPSDVESNHFFESKIFIWLHSIAWSKQY